jgi:hypothetical protein
LDVTSTTRRATTTTSSTASLKPTASTAVKSPKAQTQAEVKNVPLDQLVVGDRVNVSGHEYVIDSQAPRYSQLSEAPGTELHNQDTQDWTEPVVLNHNGKVVLAAKDFEGGQYVYLNYDKSYVSLRQPGNTTGPVTDLAIGVGTITSTANGELTAKDVGDYPQPIAMVSLHSSK